jgi:predicted AlkP superfamily pyrophosphatase or phosphodiesterase
MDSKVILIVIDGLRDDTAAAQMGYLEQLVEHRVAERYTAIAEMPTMSRPLYETIQTGTPPYVHGIASNNTVRRSTTPNVFDIVAKHGGVTAAAAYSWVSELYNQVPYEPVTCGYVDDEKLTIQHGRFYIEDSYPDSALFVEAERMLRRYAPDYMLIHPMGMDDTGHHFGGESGEYNNHAIFVDSVISNLLPGWLEKNYTVLITADHGMNVNHMHGGSGPDVRRVPLYLLRPGVTASGQPHAPVSQMQIAPTILKIMNLPIPETMKSAPIL